MSAPQRAGRLARPARRSRTRIGFAVLAFAAALTVTTAGGVLAHSLEEVEQQLGGQERYLELVDRRAPPFTLRDADGRAVSLAALRGKVVVLNFIYASCPDVCPLHSERIAELQTMVNETPMRDAVTFVSITTDPERDGPAVMQGYGAQHGLDPQNWLFLTSGSEAPEATRVLAQQYGLVFTEMAEGHQMHGIVTHVIDKSGNLRARFHGLKFDATNFLVYVNALTNDFH